MQSVLWCLLYVVLSSSSMVVTSRHSEPGEAQMYSSDRLLAGEKLQQDERLSDSENYLVSWCPEATDDNHLGHFADEWAVKVKRYASLYSIADRQDAPLDRPQLVNTANSIAGDIGMENRGAIKPFDAVFKFHYRLANDAKFHGFTKRDAHRVHKRLAELDKLLDGHPAVVWSSRQHCLRRQKRTAENLHFNDPMFSRQWHLVNSKELGHDINITEVWHSGITGKGVVIAVVDDGLEHSNRDIQMNYNSKGSYDFNSNDRDPAPNLKSSGDNTHGTKCAGLIAAVPNNSWCGVGVALGASVSGIRMLDGKVTDALEGQSFIYKAHTNWIYSCSWGPEDNGKSVEGPGILAQEALKMGTSQGRYGYGNIYVFASGNGGLMNDNCNFDGYANSIYTLTVGAVDEKNQMPYYAELCPSMLAVTYSNGHASGDRNIVTTDANNHGGCTRSFTGTSAAAPIAAGMVALMLQIRNCLSWRDVQSVLVYSAVKVDVEGAEWVENGAGFHHSDQHGFGLMDAYRLTSVARVWPLLPAMVKWKMPNSGLIKLIPSNSSSLLLPTKVIQDNKSPGLNTLEYVTVTITLSHIRRGALEISLISPNGTHSTLSTTRSYDKETSGFNGWTFATSRFWGETPTGIWILNITDTNKFPSVKRENGAVKKWTLNLYGSELTPADIQERKRLVKDAISNGSLSNPLSCPPLPSSAKELKLSLKIRTLNLWEKIVVVILAGVGAVLVIHLIFELINNKYKLWTRRQLQRSSSDTVHYINGSHVGEEMVEEGASDEESDIAETSRLIFMKSEHKKRGNEARKGSSMDDRSNDMLLENREHLASEKEEMLKKWVRGRREDREVYNGERDSKPLLVRGSDLKVENATHGELLDNENSSESILRKAVGVRVNRIETEEDEEDCNGGYENQPLLKIRGESEAIFGELEDKDLQESWLESVVVRSDCGAGSKHGAAGDNESVCNWGSTRPHASNNHDKVTKGSHLSQETGQQNSQDLI